MFCNRRPGGDRTSIRVWCSHVRSAPSYGNQVRTHDRLLTVPGIHRRKKSKKSALRISLSLDKWGPHTCSAGLLGSPVACAPCSRSSSSSRSAMNAGFWSIPVYNWWQRVSVGSAQNRSLNLAMRSKCRFRFPTRIPPPRFVFMAPRDQPRLTGLAEPLRSWYRLYSACLLAR